VHCRDHAVQLHRARERFDKAGIDLVLIGQATPRQATAFRRKLKLDPLPVLADEERTTYRIAGFGRGSIGQLLGARSALSGVKHGLRSGVVQGKVIGDATQLGGAMLIAPGGEILLHQASQHAGDTLGADDLLAATA
jgi:hypothetical protein